LVNTAPHLYPLPSGERIKVRGDFGFSNKKRFL